MLKYETHLHTAPVSICAKASVQETLEFYKQMDYDGIFITNHFLDGNINLPADTPYEEGIHFYFSDYEKALALGNELGIKVFCGVEISYGGTDFLVYGPDKAWYLSHPEIMDLPQRQKLRFLMDSGALVIQAHPYREANYIDHIRLYPRDVHGVEVINACRTEGENEMAEIYAEHYGLLKFAGSDNHVASRRKVLAGVCCEEPVTDEWDFVRKVLAGGIELFAEENPLYQPSMQV